MKNIQSIIFDLGGTLKVFGIKEIFPESKEVLEKLSKKYMLAIGANQPSYGRQFLKDFDIEKYFEKVYLSVEIGYEKPDPRFFEYILNDLKLNPENTVMVGDGYEKDIAPARELGMKTVWVNPLEETGEADHEIKNIKEILEIL